MSERFRISELVRGGFRPSAPLIVSGIATTIALIAVGIGLRDLSGAVFTSSVSESDADPLSPLTEEATKSLADARKRFDGRSVFVMPTAPVRKPKTPPTPLVPPTPPPDPGPPPPPSSYTGPMPSSILGDIVFFASNVQIRKGQTINGITVIETRAPWDVKLGHMRGEYTVPIWGKGNSSFFKTNPYPLTGAGGFVSTGTSGASAAGSATSGASSGATRTGTGTAGTAYGSLRPDGTPNLNGSTSGAVGAASTSTPSGRGGSGAAGSAASPSAAAVAGANRNATRGGAPLSPPGDEPGGDQPQGPGPGDEPNQEQSPAMDPVNLPPPEPAPQDESNYVDPATLPQPISDARISMMDMATARNALGAIDGTNSLQVDPTNRDRLANERTLLLERIQALQGGGNP